MKLLVEFNLNPKDSEHDVSRLCVDIKDIVERYLWSRQLSWDKVKVSNEHQSLKH